MSRDLTKSRPLSENVKRMMWLERASSRNANVMNAERIWTENDNIYCDKQGKLFMEAAAMGFPMSSFVPLYMTSHCHPIRKASLVGDFRQRRVVDHVSADLFHVVAECQSVE